MGRVIQAYLRGTEENGLTIVNAGGGLDVARNAYAIAYGPMMADRDGRATFPRLAWSLRTLSAEVTDAEGVTRPAQLRWVSAGWGQATFLVPKDATVGSARMTLLCGNGTSLKTDFVIADTAPGFWTGIGCLGPALGTATQILRDGRHMTSPISSCRNGLCETVAIRPATAISTRVRLSGSGFRFAKSPADIDVLIGRQRARVVSYGPGDEPGSDQLTVEILRSTKGLGETDLICHVRGRVANVVRIRVE